MTNQEKQGQYYHPVCRVDAGWTVSGAPLPRPSAARAAALLAVPAAWAAIIHLAPAAWSLLRALLSVRS